jgi:hypothetical protein
VENRTHYVRDVTFNEDHSQLRTGHAPHNLAALRNLTIDTFRATGYVNIAHARRHHTHWDDSCSAPEPGSDPRSHRLRAQ